ncbi:MAG: GNAT family N-acetyltransferase [Bacteroidales bacterium]|nr:GNAT family N-acetyltransferase [Bacteroidales bacterium]MBN2818461.1 GNAT family N-acetyltransferase [Bacteroidales bacterium]
MSIENKLNIKLRAVEPEDIDLLFQWENNQEIWHLSNTITPFSRHILTKYIETAHLDIFQTRQLRLMIDVLESGQNPRTVGAIDLFEFEPFHLRAGIGILISNTLDRNKGYASAALQSLIEYTFKTLHLNQLYCNIGTDNILSIKLFKKHGFTEVGIKKKWNKTLAGYTDEMMLQLIND